MDIAIIKEYLERNRCPAFRLKQIQKAVYQDGVSSFSEISPLPKDLREAMDKEVNILPFGVEKVLRSQSGDSMKALLKLEDGNLIETVLISPKPGTWSACISSQVGCPLSCRFCATGKAGLTRNLTAEEITDQVLFWRQYLKKENIEGTFSNIVYMGMGEPFLNWEHVEESLKRLIDKDIFGFGARSISVSTAGVPQGILEFAKEFPQVNLAISLHFADDKKRSEFMPVNRRYSLDELKKTLKEYAQLYNRKIFIEYVMLDGVNDSREDAQKLADFLKGIAKLQLIHVNLIRYNTTGGEFRSSSRIRTQQFKAFLEENRINATIRKSLGDEIKGACGQLAGK